MIDTFTKDILKDGMVVMLRDQNSHYTRGRFVVLGDRLLNKNGHIRIDKFKEDGTLSQDTRFDIMQIYTPEIVYSLDADEWFLNLIWER